MVKDLNRLFNKLNFLINGTQSFGKCPQEVLASLFQSLSC